MRGVTVGIDIAEARRGLDLVALDVGLSIVARHSRLSIEEAASLVLGELRPAMVCIDSPPQWAVAGSSREAERALLRLGVHAYFTPTEASAGPFHAWMRSGFAMYDAISNAYPLYRGGAATGTAAEYFPHASAVALAGSIGQLKDKRAFRRTVLEDNGIHTAGLGTQDALDAALGALTARIALDRGHCWVGDADEGVLLLPVATLPARWLRQEHRRNGAVKAPWPAGGRVDDREC